MFKKIIFSAFLVFSMNHIYSQENVVSLSNYDLESYSENDTSVVSSNYQQKNYDFQKHWSFGGYLGLSFWNGGTDILIAPKAYYNVSPIFLTGFGLTYIYSKYNNGLYDYNSNSFGGSIMGAVRPVEFLQFSAEYEGLQTNRGGYYIDKYWNNAIYLGLSYVSGNVSFGFRYDIIYDDNRSAYSSAFTPVVGFYF